MKNHLLLISIVILLILISFTSCNVLESKNDNCDATKWEQAKEPMVNYYSILDKNHPCGELTDTSHFISNANQLQISGSITKIYCSGEVSSRFECKNNYYAQPADYSGYTLKVGQTYQFNFENNNDYLLIQYRIKAFFNDKQIYESQELIEKVFFKDLSMDINTG